MRVNFSFTNLLGVIYKHGNVLFAADGSSIYSPAGRRVTRYSLSSHSSAATHTFSLETVKPIRCMALSRCGRLLFVVDEDGGSVLLNTDSDRVVCRIALQEETTALAFSPDGQFLAAAVGRRVQLWRVPSAHRRRLMAFSLDRTMSGHAEPISSLDWSPCGRFLLSSGQDMVSKVYRIDREDDKMDGLTDDSNNSNSSNDQRHEKTESTKRRPIVLHGHKHALVGAFFSADGTRIMTVGRDGAAWEWKFDPRGQGKMCSRSGEAVQHSLTLERDNSGSSGDSAADTFRPWIAAVRFSRELGLLVVGFVNGSFGLFKQGMFEGDPFELVHALSLSTRYIDAVAISPDGQWLAFGSSPTGQLLVWEWNTETYIFKQSTPPSIRTIAYSPDSSLLASASTDGQVKVWSAASGQCMCVFGAGSGSDDSNDHMATARTAVRSVAFSRQGRVLVSAGDDGVVRAWDAIRLKSSAAPFRALACPNADARLTAVAIDGSGEIVVGGGADGEIWVWSLRDGQLIDSLHGHEACITSLAFDPVGAGRLMSASWDKTVRLWSLFERDKKMTVLEHESDVLAAVWRPDGREIAVACLSGIVAIWETGDVGVTSSDYVLARNLDLRRDIADRPLSGAHVRSLSYSLDGQFLFVAGAFPFVGIYDADSQALLRRFPFSRRSPTKDSSGGAVCLAASPHGRQFSVVTEEGILCYSCDASASSSFDPFDLDVEVTPERVCELIEDGGEFERALTLACRLNIASLIQRVLDAVPDAQTISRVARLLHPKYFLAVLRVLSVLLDGPRIHFYLIWANSLLQTMSPGHRASSPEMRGVLTVLEKRLNELRFVDRQLRKATEQINVIKLQQSLEGSHL